MPPLFFCIPICLHRQFLFDLDDAGMVVRELDFFHSSRVLGTISGGGCQCVARDGNITLLRKGITTPCLKTIK